MLKDTYSTYLVVIPFELNQPLIELADRVFGFGDFSSAGPDMEVVRHVEDISLRCYTGRDLTQSTKRSTNLSGHLCFV
jgi:hypothetical protein